MVLTSGEGVIYNVARERMLAGTFRWTGTDKRAVVIDEDYVFDETHKSLAELTPGAWSMTNLDVPFISARAWAGSNPPLFSPGTWFKPVGSVVLARFFGSSLQTSDPTKYELIACLTTFLGGPIYPEGSPFSLTFDQSNGQQGWFRP